MLKMRVTLKHLIRAVRENLVLFTCMNYVAYGLVRLLFLTYRLSVEYHGDTREDLASLECKGIYYFWHQHILSGMFFFFQLGCAGHCIVSPSKDGVIAAFIARRLRFSVLHGSAHKTPVLLVRQALNVLKSQGRLCLIGDGSRGPSHILQPGITYLSNKSGVSTVFIECIPQWSYTVKKSWDQFKIPLPFSKIKVIVHAPGDGDCSRFQKDS